MRESSMRDTVTPEDGTGHTRKIEQSVSCTDITLDLSKFVCTSN